MSQLALVTELEKAGAITPTSLTLRDPNMPIEKFEALCAMMGQLKSSNSWWIGDLIVFGEGAFGERYAQAQEAFGLEYRTLVGYAYTARNVARRRRRAGLTFAHHREVAPKEPAEQSEWLTRAAEGGWTVQELRDNMRAIVAGDGGGSSEATGGETIDVREAARHVWLASQRNGSHYLVPVEPMMVLASALGIETA